MTTPTPNPNPPDTQRPKRVLRGVRPVVRDIEEPVAPKKPFTFERTSSVGVEEDNPSDRLIQLAGELACDGTWHANGMTELSRELAVALKAVRVVLIDGKTSCRILAQSGPGEILKNGGAGEGIASVVKLIPATAAGPTDGRCFASDATASPLQAALLHLARQQEVPAAIAIVLPTALTTAILIAWGDFSVSEATAKIQACESRIAHLVAAWQSDHSRQFPYIGRLIPWVRSQRGLMMMAVSVLIAISLAIPLPYHVPCAATIEPPVRSYLEAPFDGTLAKSLANPGDQVVAGQILARLDDRQMQLDLAAAVAAVEESQKKLQAARAGHDGTAALLAQLDLQQANVKLQTLRDRERRLLVTSPIDGIIVRGDLRRVEGSPVKQGQMLFEVAAVGEMLAELAVPEAEIAFVRPEMPVTIQLDALGGEALAGVIRRIHPRAQLQDNASIFLVEVELQKSGDATGEKAAAELRPGMHGRASITSDPHPLGWNLLHRPWQALRRAWEG